MDFSIPYIVVEWGWAVVGESLGVSVDRPEPFVICSPLTGFKYRGIDSTFAFLPVLVWLT